MGFPPQSLQFCSSHKQIFPHIRGFPRYIINEWINTKMVILGLKIPTGIVTADIIGPRKGKAPIFAIDWSNPVFCLSTYPLPFIYKRGCVSFSIVYFMLDQVLVRFSSQGQERVSLGPEGLETHPTGLRICYFKIMLDLHRSVKKRDQDRVPQFKSPTQGYDRPRRIRAPLKGYKQEKNTHSYFSKIRREGEGVEQTSKTQNYPDNFV